MASFFVFCCSICLDHASEPPLPICIQRAVLLPKHFGGISPKRSMGEQTQIRISDSADVEGAFLICCFPSVGMVSSIIGQYLLEHLDLNFSGAISDSRMPAISLVQDGRPMPPVRIYSGTPICKLENCDKVVLISSEFKVGGELAFSMRDAILEWAKENKITQGMFIDAFAKKGSPPPDPSSGEPIVEYEDTPEIDFVGVAATVDGIKLIESMEVPLLEQGLIGGMSGVVLGEARRIGMNLFSILVEADPRFPDARAASALIEKLDNLLSVVDLDTAPLLEEAERIEAQIKSMLEHQLQSQNNGKNSVPNSMLYG